MAEAMRRLPTADELTAEELAALRLVVSQSFMTRTSMSAAASASLLHLGLIQRSMGGLMPTPAGRICARIV
ncbi:MAG: hypothetical protein WDN03_10105 [Rhizomicrobium sp.]